MPLRRDYYSDSITAFLATPPDQVLGQLVRNSEFNVEPTQRDAWLAQINLLRPVLSGREGWIYFEYSIPRMGKRIDVVLLITSAIFAIEFKVGEKHFTSHAIDQVYDYALDLKNFHEPSQTHLVAPILVATEAKQLSPDVRLTPQNDRLLYPLMCTNETLSDGIEQVLSIADEHILSPSEWEQGRYKPTPTIIEAAMALYNGHSVEEISRRDASAINLSETSESISEIIRSSRERKHKSICFVTGVPGAGKTLVGLNIATKHIDASQELHSVFLSGNAPLVSVLREALARDEVKRLRDTGKKVKKGEAMSRVKMFIQNVHHYRDEYLRDHRPPIDHVAIFDEAQRAWNVVQTANFMHRKKNTPNFQESEPEFLISCLNRHSDWATIICLVGGGQEINTGEAGIAEWITSLNRSFPDWHVFISPNLTDTEYGVGTALKALESRPNVQYRDKLHLSVSMRSFRAENVSLLVKQVLDFDINSARESHAAVKERYPIVLTRDLTKAKRWLKDNARGTERYGMVVSSQAERLKPYAIDVKSPVNPIHWFLNEKDDVRSSYYLEDAATEFHVQGLELDWACVTWDADFRFSDHGWQHWRFAGNRWNRINKLDRQTYQKNAYRVLLTRARQGMVVVVPQGDGEDPTRRPEYYDPTFEYLRRIGLQLI
jgi:hypothetical protein